VFSFGNSPLRWGTEGGIQKPPAPTAFPASNAIFLPQFASKRWRSSAKNCIHFLSPLAGKPPSLSEDDVVRVVRCPHTSKKIVNRADEQDKLKGGLLMCIHLAALFSGEHR